MTLYLEKGEGEILTATVVPGVPLLDDFAFPANNKADGSTGLAVLNPSSEDATVTFMLYKSGELFDQRTITLEKSISRGTTTVNLLGTFGLDPTGFELFSVQLQGFGGSLLTSGL